MKKKKVNTYSKLYNKDITFTIDPKLDELKGRILAPKKLEQANERLRRMRSLPK